MSNNGPTQKDLDYIAGILGLPKVDDIPRPGDVGDWRLPEWKEWGKKYGFVREDKSAHAFVILHDELPLRISISSTPSDFRSGLAYGTEFRRMILAELRFSHALAGCATLENPHITGAELRAKLTDTKWRSATAEQADARRLAVLAEHEAEVRELLLPALNHLGRYGIPIKRAFMIAGLAESDAERATEVLKHDMLPKLPNMADVIDSLHDALDQKRFEEEAEEKERERARQARDDEAKKEEAKIDKSEVVYNAETTRNRNRLSSTMKVLSDRLSSLNMAFKGLQDLASEPLAPAYPKARITELMAEVEAANAKLAASVAERDILETAATARMQKIGELEKLVEGLHTEKKETEELFLEAATAPEWRTSCVKLVETLIPLLSSDNFLQLAQGVAEARATLAAAKIAVDTNTPPVL